MFDPRINGWNSQLTYPSSYEADIENPLSARVAALEAALASLLGGTLPEDLEDAVRAIVQDELP